MQLTKWTDYSLRVLMYCAAHEARATPVTISEIGQAHGISRSHLTKVVMALAALGACRTWGVEKRESAPARTVLAGFAAPSPSFGAKRR